MELLQCSNQHNSVGIDWMAFNIWATTWGGDINVTFERARDPPDSLYSFICPCPQTIHEPHVIFGTEVLARITQHFWV